MLKVGSLVCGSMLLFVGTAWAQAIGPDRMCMGPTIGDNVITSPRGEMLTLRTGGLADLLTLSGKCVRLGVVGGSAQGIVYQDGTGLLDVVVKDGAFHYKIAREN